MITNKTCPKFYSQSLYTVINELISVESLSKDHFYIHSLQIEDKYELIRLESQGLIEIQDGEIRAKKALVGNVECFFEKTA